LDRLDFVIVVLTGTHNSLQNGGLYIDFDVYLWHLIGMADDVADHVVGSGELRVNFGSHSNQTSWNSIHQLVVISLQGHNDRLDLSPGGLSCALTLSDFTWADGDFISDFETSLEDGAASDATLESLSVFTRLIDIEGTDDDHVGWDGELARWNGDATDVVDNHIDVVPQNSRDWDDGDAGTRSRRQRLLYFFLLLGDSNFVFDDQIDLVLEHDDVLEVHDVDGDQMLTGLRLGVRLITSHEQQSSVHDGCTRQHSCH